MEVNELQNSSFEYQNRYEENSWQEQQQPQQFERDNKRNSNLRKGKSFNRWKDIDGTATAEAEAARSESIPIQIHAARSTNKDMQVIATILTNRINRLVQEERKLQKKSIKYRYEADHVYERRKYNMERRQERKFREEQPIEEVPFTNPQKQLAQLRCDISKKHIEDKNKEKVRQQKIELARVFAAKEVEYKIMQESRKWQVKQAQEESLKRKLAVEEEKESKREEFKANQKSLLQSENRIVRQNQKLLHQLEQIELQEIKKLQTTKKQVTAARNQLEFSKTRDVDEYSQKYQNTQHVQKQSQKSKSKQESKSDKSSSKNSSAHKPIREESQQKQKKIQLLNSQFEQMPPLYKLEKKHNGIITVQKKYIK